MPRAPEPASDRFGNHTCIPIHRSFGYGYGAPRYEWGDEPDGEPPFNYDALVDCDDDDEETDL